MNKDFLELGKVVSTHGIRGELRVQPWCDFSVFKQVKTAYLKPAGDTLKVLAARAHGNIVIVKAKGIETVEQAEALRGTVLYLNKRDIKLPKGEYFMQDIIGCTVYDEADGSVIGEISDISQTGANDVWHIKLPTGEEVLIPKIPQVVKSVSVEDKSVVVFKMKGLFDYED